MAEGIEVLLINFLNGISLGAVLFLLAAGLSIIMGLMGILNLAHGAISMVGAYIGIALIMQGVNFILAVLAGGIVGGLLGLVMERCFLSSLI